MWRRRRRRVAGRESSRRVGAVPKLLPFSRRAVKNRCPKPHHACSAVPCRAPSPAQTIRTGPNSCTRHRFHQASTTQYLSIPFFSSWFSFINSHFFLFFPQQLEELFNFSLSPTKIGLNCCRTSFPCRIEGESRSLYLRVFYGKNQLSHPQHAHFMCCTLSIRFELKAFRQGLRPSVSYFQALFLFGGIICIFFFVCMFPTLFKNYFIIRFGDCTACGITWPRRQHRDFLFASFFV